MPPAPVQAPGPPRDPAISDALDDIADGTILQACGAAERLRRFGIQAPAVGDGLIALLEHGDALAAMLGLHALGAVPGRRAAEAITLSLGDPELREHAAWALAGRPRLDAALAPLGEVVATGGFPAMPAQLALERWGIPAGDLLADRSPPAIEVRPERSRRGVRVAQILLRGQVDAELVRAGSGDGGGVVTQLVQLTRELGRHPDVERSILIARPPSTGPVEDEPLGPGGAIVRLPFGPSEQVPVGDMWRHRAQVERAIAAALAIAGGIDVAHLRYADAGTFAAARALRRAGVRIVFTLAPDPHALIDEGERTGRLTRASFAAAELTEHALFRLRLVDDLAARADRTVTLPRAGGRPELERLVGRRLRSRRTSEVAEGIALAPIARARERIARGAGQSQIATDLRSAVEQLAPERLGLPLIVSVGRFHPVKGFPRLVEAWGGDLTLADAYNLVLAGGDLERPARGEQAVLDEIARVASRHPAVACGLVLLGGRSHADVAELLAIGRQGLAEVVAPGAIYACASAKEEFGVAILEALATGLPVVAPAGGGPGSYVEHGVLGSLVQAGSVEDLRTGLHEAALLVGDNRRAARATALVRERFSIEPMASTLAETYRRAVEG